MDVIAAEADDQYPRHLIASPWRPGPTCAPAAHPHPRRRTYVMALEQAEQMFHAAHSVGPATSPLLLFYGLSQAGRAVAAAAKPVTRPDGW